MRLVQTLRIALPCILIFGAIGALVGGILGDGINGIRAGIVVGGAIAFLYLQKKNSSSQ
jgi:hypothetical protein